MHIELAIEVLKNFGIKEDLPKSKKHLNYETLDLKSKRIMNRLIIYLKSNGLHLDKFLGEIIKMQAVKTKTK